MEHRISTYTSLPSPALDISTKGVLQFSWEKFNWKSQYPETSGTKKSNSETEGKNRWIN